MGRHTSCGSSVPSSDTPALALADLCADVLVLHSMRLGTSRENTEGEYSGLEHEAVPGVVESLKVLLPCHGVCGAGWDGSSKIVRSCGGF
jgi:hypothetical protein